MKPLMRYALMKSGDDNRYPHYERDRIGDKISGRYPTENNYEARFRDRTGREHYDNGRFAPMRSAYTDEYPSMNIYDTPPMYNDDISDIESGRRWEIIENNRGTPFRPELNEDGMRRIHGFSAHHGSGVAVGERMEYGQSNVVPMLTRDMAEGWMQALHNADGTKGPHWTLDEVKKLMQQRGLQHDPVRMWVAMNAEYSDSVIVNRKHGVDKPEFYMDAAIARWLNDKDAVPNKEAAYFTYIVKH